MPKWRLFTESVVELWPSAYRAAIVSLRPGSER